MVATSDHFILSKKSGAVPMFSISKKDINNVVLNHLLSVDPLIIKNVPAKEKRKYILLCMIIHFFKKDYFYTEKEINDILKPMTNDYVDLRRFLINYKFLDRKTDGSSYWVIIDHQDYVDYKFI
jgi:hypothetical protein